MKKIYQISLICTLFLGLIACQEEAKQSGNVDVATDLTNDTEKVNDEIVAPIANDTYNDVVATSDKKSNSSKSSKADPTNPVVAIGGTNVDVPPPPPVIEEIIEREVVAQEDAYDFHEYQKLNSFLGKYVSSGGNVNYSSIKANNEELTAITKEFETNFPGSGWSSTQKLTYWINAYNVYTIQLIVDNYPTTSIKKITAEPWLKKFIKLNGSTYSLNQIENDIIRKQFNEPRIHFALNCASKSCPVLLNKAYTPKKLYGQLTSQTKRFLNDTSKNQFTEKSIKISSIFDWYSADFNKNGKTTIDFINQYRTEQLVSPKVSYMEYSWDLNK